MHQLQPIPWKQFVFVGDNLIKLKYHEEDIVRERSNCYLLEPLTLACTVQHNSAIDMVISDEPYLALVETTMWSVEVQQRFCCWDNNPFASKGLVD
jgi:hypothetical protein